MSGTKISAATHAAVPINPASRVPIADPNQVGVVLTAAASDIARSGTSIVLSMSAMGFVSDATNGIAYGATAPAGATGQEAAINTAFAAAVTAATTLGVAGVKIIWDVAVALGGPVYLYSNMTIEAPNPMCGAINRANAQTPIFRLKGMDADQTIAANSQKSFGKYDPAHAGDTRYRVFDPAYVNAQNVTIVGGTWNANAAQGTRSPNYNGLYGYVMTFQFWGLDGGIIRDCFLFQPICYSISLINVNRIVVDNVDNDVNSPATGGTAGCQVNGPAQFVVVRNMRSHCFDDHVAFNGDDYSNSNAVGGVSYAASGAITDCLVDGLEIWNGRENTLSANGVRILSNVALVDRITVRRVSGTTTVCGFLMRYEGGCLISGTGNCGRIIFEDNTLDVTSPISHPGIWEITFASIESVEIRGRYRRNATSAVPDIYMGGVAKSLRVEGEWYQPAGASVNEPIVQVISTGNIADLTMDVRFIRDISLGYAAAPVLTTAGTVSWARIKAMANRITNLVTVTAGTTSTLKLEGIHADTNGGSPLDVSSGATVTNYIYGTGAYPLAYNAGSVTAKSGSGTVTNTNTFIG